MKGVALKLRDELLCKASWLGIGTVEEVPKQRGGTDARRRRHAIRVVAGEIAIADVPVEPDADRLPEVGRQRAYGLADLLVLQRNQSLLAVDVAQFDVVVGLNEQCLALVLLHQVREREANLIDVAKPLLTGGVLVCVCCHLSSLACPRPIAGA